MKAIELLRNALARIVTARETLGYGDTNETATILYELEVDLAGALSQVGDDIERVRLDDFNTIPDLSDLDAA